MFLRDRSCRGNKTPKLRSLIRLHGRWTANSYIMLPSARGAHGLCLIIQTISPTTFLAHSILRFLLLGLHLRLEVTHPLVKSGRVVSLCFTEISHRGPKIERRGVWYSLVLPYPDAQCCFQSCLWPFASCIHAEGWGGGSSRSSRDIFSGTMVARTREIHLPMV